MNEFDTQGYDETCFACGEKNPIGLKLKFEEQDDQYITRFTPNKNHQGYPGILHGGLTTTILDEVMGRYLFDKGYIALTAEINVRFRKAIPVEKPLIARAKILTQKSRMVELLAEIEIEDGVIAAQAIGKFMLKGNLTRKGD